MSLRWKPANERMFCSDIPAVGRVSQRGDDVTLPECETGALALHQAERRLQRGRRKSDRGRDDRCGGQKFLRDQNRAAIEFAEMGGIEQPCPELAPRACRPPESARDRSGFPAALPRSGATTRRIETLSGDNRCGNRAPPISAHARSEDWFRCGRYFPAGSDRAGRPSPINPAARSAPVSVNSPHPASAGRSRRSCRGCAVAAISVLAPRLQHDVQRHRQPRRERRPHRQGRRASAGRSA